MPEFKEKVRIDDVEVIRDTDKAILCLIGGEEVWLPQGQIDDDSECWQQGDTGLLVISEWIARQKGLVE